MSSIHQSFCGSSKQSANCRQLKNAKVIISIPTILLSFQVSKKSRNFSKIGKQFNVWLEVPVPKATSLVTKSSRRERDSKFIKGLYKWLFWDSYYSWGWCLGHQPWTIVGESWGAWEKSLKLGGGKKGDIWKTDLQRLLFSVILESCGILGQIARFIRQRVCNLKTLIRLESDFSRVRIMIVLRWVGNISVMLMSFFSLF